MITLAHMSDVHLAPLPPVRGRDLMNKRILGYLNWRLRRQSTLAGDGLTNLVRHMRDKHPDLTAITGDLVNLGLEAEANTAANWLQTVGPAESVAVSPGNHDAYVRSSLPTNADRWGAEEIELTNQKHNVSQIFRFPDSRQYKLEAEAFAYLATRSHLGLPLSVPGTTGVPEPMTGGRLHKPQL